MTGPDLSDPFGQPSARTTVHRASGNVNSGSGPQVIFQGDHFMRQIGGLDEGFATGKHRGRWLEEHFVWLRARFVPPPGTPDIEDSLRARRTVLLRGKEGTGRRTAAMMLLQHCGSAAGRFTELLPNFDKAELDPFEKGLALEQGDRVLLDLSTIDSLDFQRSVPLLPPLFGDVYSKKAFLVVVLPDIDENYSDLASLTVDHRRPEATQVMARHLRFAGFSSEEIQADPRTSEYARRAPFQKIHELSELMRRIRGGEPSTAYSECVDRALAVVKDGRAGPRALLAGRTGAERVLLLSAAMLSGASSTAVWDTGELIRRRVEYPPDPSHMLDRADFLDQLSSVGVVVDDHDFVRFKDPVEEQLRAYFWDAYPKLREMLAPWVLEAMTAGAVSVKESSLLVERLAEILFRAGRISTIDQLIQHWAKSENNVVAGQARALLEHGLADEHHGAHFRNQMWQWSQGDTGDGLGAVLIGACTRVLAQSHPEQALTRLRHLARSSGKTGEVARAALAELVGDNVRLLRRLLYKIAEAGYVRDVETFVVAGDPFQFTNSRRWGSSMVREPIVREQLVGCWHAVYAAQPENWKVRLGTWLEAGTGSVQRAPLLGVLGEAADARTRGRLFAAAAEWAGGAGERRATLELLLDHINAAQGIAFVAAGAEGQIDEY